MPNDNAAIEYVTTLTEEIGPRPATSEEEYGASEWIAQKFESRGLQTRVQNFRAPATFAWASILYFVLSILGAILSGLDGWVRILALVFALASAVLFYLDYEMIWGFSNLFARKHSQNVVAKHTPRGTRGERVRKIVLVAHYDTPRSSVASAPALASKSSLLFAITKCCVWSIPALIVLQMLFKPQISTWIWYATLAAAVYLLFPLVVELLGEIAGKEIAGANGNASGVAALLGVADNLMLPHEEVQADEQEEERPHAAGRSKAKVVEGPVLYGREAIEEAAIAPAEATIEYAAEARAASPKVSETGTFARIKEGDATPAAPVATPAPAAEPRGESAPTPLQDLPVEGFPAGLTVDMSPQVPAAPSVAPAAPVPTPVPAPVDVDSQRTGELPVTQVSVSSAPVPDPSPQPSSAPSAPAPADTTLPGAEPLKAEIPTIDDIALPGETRAFTPVGTSSATGSLGAIPPIVPPVKQDSVDLDAMFAPKEPVPPEPVYEKDEGWESDLTEDFAAIPDSRVRELGSQVTGMFAKIVPGKRKKKSEDEEEALGSWLHGSKKKRRGNKDDDSSWTGDDDEIGWSGGATPARGDGELSIQDRLEKIKEEVLSVADRDLLDKEVWFVATGAETSGAWGMRSFLQEYDEDLKGAMIVVLDSVGGGELSWITSEGMMRPRKADRRIMSLGKRVARNEVLGVKSGKVTSFWTDGAAALAKKKNALTLMGLEGKMPANWGSPNDTIDELDEETLSDAIKLVTGMIREL